MGGKIMIIRKKTILMVSLIFLLVVVGFLNHQLTKQSLLESSNEYQDHEMNELAENEDGNSVQTSAEEDVAQEELEIVDSKDSEISDITTEANSSIEETISKEENIKSSNYFVEYRLSRDKMRSSLIDRLSDIVSNEKTNEEMRTEAQKEIMRIGSLIESELFIEGLIKAKGFEDALVFLQESSARIVVSVNDLTEQDVMKILEIVKSETNIDPADIKIMKKF